MLSKLLNKKRLCVLGVNSGTSVDGLDLSLARISERRGGGLAVAELAHRSVKYPLELRSQLLELGHAELVKLDELTLTDEALGAFIGKRCRKFIADQRRSGLRVDCVASHGQTIRHLPKTRRFLEESINSTVQIGSAERIAALTGLPVISSFRQADTALGGEGAPITTTAVAAALAHARESRLLVNIGGIANLFYLPAEKPLRAAEACDIGPGNMLLDLASSELFGREYDKKGALAASGAVSARLLTLLESERFFDGGSDTTRSTGRERYGAAAFRKILSLAKELKLSDRDLLATLSQFSAERILLAALKIAERDKHLKTIHLTGGGPKNRDLFKRIKSGSGALRVRGLQELGFHPDFFEALCFAILGYYCIRGIGAPSTKIDQTSRPILGRISQAPLTASAKR